MQKLPYPNWLPAQMQFIWMVSLLRKTRTSGQTEFVRHWHAFPAKAPRSLRGALMVR
jgi:hypothetical protein